MTFKSGDEYDG